MTFQRDDAPVGGGTESHYDVLGLQPQATLDEIEAAYTDLSAMFAADKIPASRQEYARKQRRRLAAAYAVLGDPEERTAYDRRLAGATSVRPPARAAAELAAPSFAESPAPDERPPAVALPAVEINSAWPLLPALEPTLEAEAAVPAGAEEEVIPVDAMPAESTPAPSVPVAEMPTAAPPVDVTMQLFGPTESTLLPTPDAVDVAPSAPVTEAAAVLAPPAPITVAAAIPVPPAAALPVPREDEEESPDADEDEVADYDDDEDEEPPWQTPARRPAQVQVEPARPAPRAPARPGAPPARPGPPPATRPGGGVTLPNRREAAQITARQASTAPPAPPPSTPARPAAPRPTGSSRPGAPRPSQRSARRPELEEEEEVYARPRAARATPPARKRKRNTNQIAYQVMAAVIGIVLILGTIASGLNGVISQPSSSLQPTPFIVPENTQPPAAPTGENNAPPDSAKAARLLEQAKVFEQQNNWAQAELTYLQVLKADKTNAEATYGLMHVYQKLGNPTQAEQYAGRLLLYAPGSTMADEAIAYIDSLRTPTPGGPPTNTRPASTPMATTPAPASPTPP